MIEVTFGNFIGFGNRMSIDIRVTYTDMNAWNRKIQAGKLVSARDKIVQQFQLSDEYHNTGDSAGISKGFNEMARGLLMKLAVELDARGLSAMHKELGERLRLALDPFEQEQPSSLQQDEGYSYIDPDSGNVAYNSDVAVMGTLIGFLYELNNETFNVID